MDNEEFEDNVTTEDSPAEENSDSDFSWSKVMPIIIAIVLIIIAAYKFLLPALIPGDHAPTSVIEQSQDGEYVNEIFERFRQ